MRTQRHSPASIVDDNDDDDNDDEDVLIFRTPMAHYSLFVLKLPLNTSQLTNHSTLGNLVYQHTACTYSENEQAIASNSRAHCARTLLNNLHVSMIGRLSTVAVSRNVNIDHFCKTKTVAENSDLPRQLKAGPFHSKRTD